MKLKDRIKVTQIRSEASRPKNFRETLSCLGLHGIGSSVEHSVNPAIFGMLKRVEAVITVEKIDAITKETGR